MIISLAIATLFMTPQAVPPPMEQVTADCDRPVYASDQFICADPELLRQERAIAAQWQVVEAVMPVGEWIEEQPVWFKRRALCAFQANQRRCVEAANSERLTLFAAITPSQNQQLSTANCFSAGRRQSLRIHQGPDTVSAYDDDGLAWIAVRATTDWAPFNEMVRGRQFVIQRRDGVRISCRLGSL